MAQLVTRVDDELAAAVDALVEAGAVESRSAAVRQGLEQLIDTHRRREIGEQIVAGTAASHRTTTPAGPIRPHWR